MKTIINSKKLMNFFSSLLLCLLLVLLFCFAYEKSKYTKNISYESSIVKKQLYENDKNFNVNIFYPAFENNKINFIVNNYIDKYKKEFKGRVSKNEEYLKVGYDLTFVKNYLIIYFNIDDSTNVNRTGKSIIVDTTSNEVIKLSEFVEDEKEFSLIVKDKVNKKYSKEIKDKILKMDINSYDINVRGKEVYVIFNDIKDIGYVPFINFRIRDNNLFSIKTFNESGDEKIRNKKYIALTFDDGPNKETTNSIIDTLALNNAKATFFVLGNRIKYNKEVIFRQNAIGNEIGNHTYSHKNLTRVTLSEFDNELNSTNILYNEITSKYINLLRPPYGAVNKFVKKHSPNPIILWDIDTKDWMSLDAKKVSNHVLENVRDGDIVLMHDIYKSTAEAVKIMVPILKERGFELVTISDLARIKNVPLEKGKVYRNFK